MILDVTPPIDQKALFVELYEKLIEETTVKLTAEEIIKKYNVCFGDYPKEKQRFLKMRLNVKQEITWIESSSGKEPYSKEEIESERRKEKNLEADLQKVKPKVCEACLQPVKDERYQAISNNYQ